MLPVGRHELANAPRRWSVAVVAVLVPAAAFLTAGTGAYPRITGDPLCCAELVAATAPNVGLAAGARHSFTAPSGDRPAQRARASDGDYRNALPVGVATETGLQVKTILAARAVSATFSEIRDISGVRPDSLKWHPNGLAIDVMIPNYQSAQGKALGDRIVAFAFENADRFGLENVIWRQTLYERSGSPQLLRNLGSDNANHYTHVHFATDGGGYPTNRADRQPTPSDAR